MGRSVTTPILGQYVTKQVGMPALVLLILPIRIMGSFRALWLIHNVGAYHPGSSVQLYNSTHYSLTGLFLEAFTYPFMRFHTYSIPITLGTPGQISTEGSLPHKLLQSGMGHLRIT